MPSTPGGGVAENGGTKNKKANGVPKNKKANGGARNKKPKPQQGKPPPLFPGGKVKDGAVIHLNAEDIKNLSRAAHKFVDKIDREGAALFVPPASYDHPAISEVVVADGFWMKPRYQQVPCAPFKEGKVNPEQGFEEANPISMKQFEGEAFEAQRRSGLKVIRPIFANPLPLALKKPAADNEVAFFDLMKLGELVLDGDPEAPMKRRPGHFMYGVDVEEKGVYCETGCAYSILNTKRKRDKGPEKTKKDSAAPCARVEQPIVQQNTVAGDTGVRGVDGNSAHPAHCDIGGASPSLLPAITACRVGPSSQAATTTGAGPSSGTICRIAASNREQSNEHAIVVPHGGQQQCLTPKNMPSQTPPPQLSHTANDAHVRDVPHESPRQFPTPPPAALRNKSNIVTQTRQTTMLTPANAVDDSPVGKRTALTSTRVPTTGMSLSMNSPRSRVVGHELGVAAHAPVQNTAAKVDNTGKRVKRKSYQIGEIRGPYGEKSSWRSRTNELENSPPTSFPNGDIATNGPSHEMRTQVPLQYNPDNSPYTGESRRETAYGPVNEAASSASALVSERSPRLLGSNGPIMLSRSQSNADSTPSLHGNPVLTKSGASSSPLSPVGSATLRKNSLTEETVLESGNGNQADSNPSTPLTPSNYAGALASAQEPSTEKTFLETVTPTYQPVQTSDAVLQIPSGGSKSSRNPSQVGKGGLRGGCVFPPPKTQFPGNDIGLSELGPEISAQAAINGGTVVEEVLDQGTSQSMLDESLIQQCVSETPITLEELREKGSGRKPISHVGNINENGVLRHSPPTPGINSSMYYVGLAGSKFCCHVEDSWLNSISYNHRGGALKTWYSVPPEYATELEKYAAKHLFIDTVKTHEAAGYFASKTIMLNPHDVAEYGIPVYRHHHTPGTYVMTACRGYHFGFNHGFNIAEAVNYADPSWFEHGMSVQEPYRKQNMVPSVPVEYLIYQETLSLCKKIEEVGMEEAKKDPFLVMCAKKTAQALGKYVVVDNRLVRKTVRERGATVEDFFPIYHHLPHDTKLFVDLGNGAGIRCKKCGHIAHFYFKACFDCNPKNVVCCLYCKEDAVLCKNKTHRICIVRRHSPYLLLTNLKPIEELGGIKMSFKVRLERFEDVVENFKEEKHIRMKSTHRIKFTLSKADSMGENADMPALDSEHTAHLFTCDEGMDLAEQYEKAPRELRHVMGQASMLIRKSKDRRENADGNEYDNEVETANGAGSRTHARNSRDSAKRRFEEDRNVIDSRDEQPQLRDSKNPGRRSASEDIRTPYIVDRESDDDSMTKKRTRKQDDDDEWMGAKKANAKRKRVNPTKDNPDYALLMEQNPTTETRTTSSGRQNKTPVRYSPDRNNASGERSKRRRPSRKVVDDGDDNDRGEVSSIDRQHAGPSGSSREVSGSVDKNVTTPDRPSPSEPKVKSSTSKHGPGLVLAPANKVVHDQQAGSLDGPSSRGGQERNALGGQRFEREVGPSDEHGMTKDNPARDSYTRDVDSPNGLDRANHDTGLLSGIIAAGSTRGENDEEQKDTVMREVGDLNVGVNAAGGLVSTDSATNGLSYFKNGNNLEPGPVKDGDGLKGKPTDGGSAQTDCERLGQMDEDKDEVMNVVNDDRPEPKIDGNDDKSTDQKDVDVVPDCNGDATDTRDSTGNDDAALLPDVAGRQMQETNVEQPETQDTYPDDSDDDQLDEACDAEVSGGHDGIDHAGK